MEASRWRFQRRSYRMTSPAPHFLASCDNCGRSFKVPDPAKVYGCKACEGGRIRVAPPACPECEEAISADDQFCQSCGVALGDSTDADGGSDTKQHSAADATARAEARPASRVASRASGSRKSTSGNRKSARGGKARSTRRAVSGELNRSLKSVRVLRTFFILNAALHLIGTGLAVAGFGLTGGDRSAFLILLLIQASLSAVMLAGVFLVMHQPAIWALVMACMVTLSRMIAAWEMDWNMAYVGIGGIWALLFWAMVAPASRAKRLLDENPDLGYAKRMEQARPRAVRKAIVAAVGVLVISGASAFFLHVGSQAVPLGPTWNRFVDDWEATRLEAVLETVEEGVGAAGVAEFEAEVKDRGWDTDLPDLGAAASAAAADFGLYSVEEPGSDMEAVYLETEQGQFEFGWRYFPLDQEWRLVELRYPMAVFSPDLLLRIKGQWEASDIQGLGAMFPDPDRSTPKLERSFRARGWEREFPAILGVEILTTSNGVDVYFDTEAGENILRYGRGGGDWILRSVKLTPR